MAAEELVTDTDRELGAAARNATVVLDDTLVDGGIGNLHLIAVEREQHGAAHVQVLDDTCVPADIDQVAAVKGIAHTEQDACQKILGDVTQAEADDDADQPRAPKHGDGQPGQSGKLQHEIDAQQKDRDCKRPRHHRQQQRGLDTVREQSPNRQRHQSGDQPCRQDDKDGERHQRPGPNHLPVEAFEFLARARKGGADIGIGLDPVDDGNSALRVLGQRASPGPMLLRPRCAIEKDHPVMH